MTQYVLTLSIGPVQGFIASARRSRDLWSASWLLSEMAKAAAKSLFEAGAQMVFPFVDETTKDRLEPCDRMDNNFSVGNKIQVQVEAADDAAVRDLVEQAKAAAQSRFETIARQARQDLNAALRDEIWQMQLNDYLEIQAAWVRITEKGYSDASQRAASALAARKATRDFTPAHAADAWDKRFMLPKSSLDGARETVLLEKANGDADLSDVARRKLGLSRSEQLDCAGIVKRLGGNSEQFTPVTRVAADAWLQGLPENELSKLCDAYEPLIALNLATRVKGNQGIYSDFPFDGQLLYRNRLDAALSDNKSSADASEKLSKLKNVLKTIWHKYGEPCSYWAMLLADGDCMGELLDRAKTIEEHQAITEALSTFTESVPAKMRDFRAQCVYAGGDDVLGFVALDKAVGCADTLRQAFSEQKKRPHGPSVWQFATSARRSAMYAVWQNTRRKWQKATIILPINSAMDWGLPCPCVQARTAIGVCNGVMKQVWQHLKNGKTGIRRKKSAAVLPTTAAISLCARIFRNPPIYPSICTKISAKPSLFECWIGREICRVVN